MMPVHFNASQTNGCGTCNLCCRKYAGNRFVTRGEIRKIAASGATDFFQKKPEFDFFVLKDKAGYCMFYDRKAGRCSIYTCRPADCRFFPYDLLRKGGKYFWIKWKIEKPAPGCLIYAGLDDEAEVSRLEKMVLPGFRGALKAYTGYTDYMIAKSQHNFKIIREMRPGKKKRHPSGKANRKA